MPWTTDCLSCRSERLLGSSASGANKRTLGRPKVNELINELIINELMD